MSIQGGDRVWVPVKIRSGEWVVIGGELRVGRKMHFPHYEIFCESGPRGLLSRWCTVSGRDVTRDPREAAREAAKRSLMGR